MQGLLRADIVFRVVASTTSGERHRSMRRLSKGKIRSRWAASDVFLTIQPSSSRKCAYQQEIRDPSVTKLACDILSRDWWKHDSNARMYHSKTVSVGECCCTTALMCCTQPMLGIQQFAIVLLSLTNSGSCDCTLPNGL